MEWIIVTGDSKGLGYNIAKKILETTNFGVLGISRSSTSERIELQKKFPNRYEYIYFDLNKIDEIKELFVNQIKDFKRIAGLVNNSAVAYDDIASNIQYDPLLNMYNVNVFAPMLLTKYVIRQMILNKIPGSIVNISSISAHTGYKGLAMYASTKGAIEAFSKNIAREWGQKGIRSNCVVPGFMETGMSESLNNEQKQRIYNRTSLKKETNIESVAETVVFLLTDKSKSITGTIINVDSGTI